MGVKAESPTDSRSPSEASLTLEVRPSDAPDCWEVLRPDSHDPLWKGLSRWEASEKAINHLSATCGGEVVEWSPAGCVIERQPVPKALSRAGIIKVARAGCERDSVSLIGPETAVEFDVPAEDLEFAAALQRFCSEPGDARWKETDLGFAFQHGRYVLWNRDSGRFALEEMKTTAAAMRRFERIRRDDLAQIRTGLMVLARLAVRSHDGKEFVLEPGDVLRRGIEGRYAKLGPGWVEVVTLSLEQVEAQRPVLVLNRDLDHFLVSASDAALFEELTGEKFIKHLPS